MNCNHSYGHYGYCPHEKLLKGHPENNGFEGLQGTVLYHDTL